MNPYTGDIKQFTQSEIDDGTAVKQGFSVPVKRDLSAREIADQKIRLYAPCACNSGIKFKFCCWKKGGTR